MKLHDKAQAKLNEVVARLQAGDLAPVVKVATATYAEDMPAAKWTFSNQVLALMTTGSLDARGYNQWQAVGRQVRKGETCGYILVPLTSKKERTNAKGQTEEYYQCYGFKAVAVFGYEQTEGEPLPGYDTPKQLPPLVDVAERLGVKVSYEPSIDPHCRGSISVDGQRMRLHTDDPAVFFHELAHRANMEFEKLQGGQHEAQEVTAELTAAVLMAVYDLGDRTGNAWQYIKAYASDPVQAIQKAMGTVGKVLDVLFAPDFGEVAFD